MPADTSNPASVALWSIFDDKWEFDQEHQPEWATLRGDLRFNDKLTDYSSAGHKKIADANKSFLARLDEIKRDDLSEEDRDNEEVFRFLLTVNIRNFDLKYYQLQVEQLQGPHLGFANMLTFTPFSTEKHFQDFTSRLHAFGSLIEQLIETQREGIAEKRTQPLFVVNAVIGQCEKQIVEDVTKSPFYKPVADEKNELVSDEVRDSFKKLIGEVVVPGYRKLKTFLEEEYTPHARESAGVWSVPQGEELYARLTEKFTTTKLSPQEVHDVGVKEVTRLREEIHAVLSSQGYEGTFPELQKQLLENKDLFFKDSEGPIKAYEELLEKVYPLLPKFFGLMPEAKCVMKKVQEYAQVSA